ncbi:MAG TPA: potassium-transporting ATPase subunit KdpC [Candidatus Binatia bacterium]|jgi:K+-transporting ATPase ATPase C chain
MKGVFGVAVRTTIVTLVITGLIYPFVMTGIAQVLLPWRANGSLITDEKGQVIGSELIAQGFANPAYFQPRPSAAGDKGYDAANSSGSNLGSTSKKLQDRIKDDVKRLKAENPDATGPIPAELVTTSGSGLDPHLSPAAMLWQVPRVAKARGVTRDRVEAVVTSNIDGRTFGILGEPTVNVLLVNLALDRQFGKATPLPPAPEKKETKEAPKEASAPAQPMIQTAPAEAK